MFSYYIPFCNSLNKNTSKISGDKIVIRDKSEFICGICIVIVFIATAIITYFLNKSGKPGFEGGEPLLLGIAIILFIVFSKIMFVKHYLEQAHLQTRDFFGTIIDNVDEKYFIEIGKVASQKRFSMPPSIYFSQTQLTETERKNIL